jgi:hypothetical protein
MPLMSGMNQELEMVIECRLMENFCIMEEPYATLKFNFRRYNSHYCELPETERKRKEKKGGAKKKFKKEEKTFQ